MAVAYEVLADQQVHPLADVLAKISATGAGNPMDRLSWVMKHGKRSSQWFITIQGNTVSMKIP